jgi:SNF2 family DNA or RNA helicase
LLQKLIPDAIQVKGADKDEAKEEKLMSFADGKSRVLVIKPKIGAFGLNFQHCSHVTFFPSHSYEQYYQSVRRCWRFGQKNPVTVDIVMTEGEKKVMQNLQRKSKAADEMFGRLVAEMNNAVSIDKVNNHTKKQEKIGWL